MGKHLLTGEISSVTYENGKKVYFFQCPNCNTLNQVKEKPEIGDTLGCGECKIKVIVQEKENVD